MKRLLFIFGFILPFAIVACFSIYLNSHEVFRRTHKYGIKGSASRLRTAYSLLHSKAKGLILGSSTASTLNLDHPGWKDEAQPLIYANNSYAMFYENLRIFQHAQAIQPLKQVVFDLFFDNNININTHMTDFSEERLYTNIENKTTPLPIYIFKLLPDIHEALFSEAALGYISDSIMIKLKIDGPRFQLPEPPTPEIARKKYQETFQPNYSACKHYPKNREKIIDRMKIFLSTARENQTELKMFTSVFHAKRMRNIQGKSCWMPYKQWLTDLVTLVTENNKFHPNETQFELWGFSQYNAMTTEAIRPLNKKNKSDMKWFIDGVHYRQNLGNLIMDRMFDHKDPRREIPDGFGVLLTEENLADYFKELENGLERYKKEYPSF